MQKYETLFLTLHEHVATLPAPNAAHVFIWQLLANVTFTFRAFSRRMSGRAVSHTGGNIDKCSIYTAVDRPQKKRFPPVPSTRP